MPAEPSPPPGADRLGSRRELGGKVLRYAAGSVVATVCSEAAFLLMYGTLDASPAVASGVGWLAGAVPNYWLNRAWTWKRRGPPSLTREVLPYVAIILVTLLIAAVATSRVDGALGGTNVADGVRVALVGGTFLSVYGVMFLVRFFLLDQLFGRAPTSPAAGPITSVSAEGNL